jgi:hypothetical protein
MHDDDRQWFEAMDETELAVYEAESAAAAAAYDRGERPHPWGDRSILYLRTRATELLRSEGLQIRFAHDWDCYGDLILEYKLLPDGETDRLTLPVGRVSSYLNTLVTGIRMGRGVPIFPSRTNEVAAL